MSPVVAQLLGGASAKFAVLALVAVAAALLAYGLLLVLAPDPEQGVEGRLKSWGAEEAEDGEPGERSLVETGLVRRAVAITGQLAGDAGLLARTATLLEQANIPLRPAEALFLYGSGVSVIGLLVLVAAPSLATGLVFALVVAIAPVAALLRLQKRRLQRFEAQLPDTLQLLGGSLRAGYSLLQGFEAVAQEASEPMARELRRVLAEARLGRALEDALTDAAERMQSRDFDWAVMAIRIQREVGGNLAELLQTVADTMTQRERIRREVRSLTAEGRISALVMGILPVGLAGFLFMVSPTYIGTLFHSGAGIATVTGSALLAGGGMVWLQRIIKIEV